VITYIIGCGDIDGWYIKTCRCAARPLVTSSEFEFQGSPYNRDFNDLFSSGALQKKINIVM